MISPPTFTAPAVQSFLRQAYGLAGELETLVSERDQNFQLTMADGRRFVVKIANEAEDAVATDFQIQALEHLKQKQCRVIVPGVVHAEDGSSATHIVAGDTRYTVRVVTYIPGKLLSEVNPDMRLAHELGEALAIIDLALHDFEHAGDCQDLQWDMQRATELRGLVRHIGEPELRAIVHECFDNFERNALPLFDSLRRQVIHNDLNPANVLVTENGPTSVAGIIDFSDMLRAPLIVDVAIAASYLRPEGEDALALAISLAAGFDTVTPLEEQEISLLHDLIRTRLATTITMKHWRKSVCADDDAYLQQSLRDELGAEGFLARVSAVSPGQFASRILQASSTSHLD